MNQLKAGSRWSDVKRIIGVSILGGGKRKYTSHQKFKKHYKLVDESSEQFTEGIELVQYSVFDFEPTADSSPALSMGHFFYQGTKYDRTGCTVTNHKPWCSESFFGLARYQSFPENVKQAYLHNERQYGKCSHALEASFLQGETNFSRHLGSRAFQLAPRQISPEVSLVWLS